MKKAEEKEIDRREEGEKGMGGEEFDGHRRQI